jgi:hypothetical protein
VDPLQADIDKAARRAAHYWVQDGLQEAIVGVFLVLVGAFLVIQGSLPRKSPLQAIFAIGFPILVIGLGLLVRHLVARLKDRYVHPRTGFVAFRRRSRRAGLASGLLGGVIAFMVVLATRAPWLVSWVPALQGALFGAALLYVGRKVELPRFSVEGALAALAGLALALLRLDDNLAAGLLFVWTGTAMAVGGVLAFRSYLRHAPPGEQP